MDRCIHPVMHMVREKYKFALTSIMQIREKGIPTLESNKLTLVFETRFSTTLFC
jgi:hypothetical protein